MKLDTTKLTNWLFEEARTKGTTFVLLLLISWFLYSDGQRREKEYKEEMKVIKTDVKACQDQLYMRYQEDHSRMIKIIEENSAVIRTLLQ